MHFLELLLTITAITDYGCNFIRGSQAFLAPQNNLCCLDHIIIVAINTVNADDSVRPGHSDSSCIVTVIWQMFAFSPSCALGHKVEAFFFFFNMFVFFYIFSLSLSTVNCTVKCNV